MLSRACARACRRFPSYHPPGRVGLTARTLTTFEKHRDIFDKLGIDKTNNKGVFDGEWKGSGPVMPSINPVNNQVIAEVVSVTYSRSETIDICRSIDPCCRARRKI